MTVTPKLTTSNIPIHRKLAHFCLNGFSPAIMPTKEIVARKHARQKLGFANSKAT